MGDNRPPTRPCTRLFIKAMEAQQQNNPRPRSMSRPPNPDQPSSSSRSQPSRAVSVPRFRAPTPQAVPKALPPSRGQSTAAKPKIAAMPRASGPSKKREAAPSPPEPTKKPRIKPAPIERPPQEVSELICVGLKGSGSSDAVDNSALEAMIKKRLARRATSNEAPSEPSVKRMAMKKPDLAEPQIVINPGPRGKKPPLTSATSSTTITSKPADLKPLAILDTGPKPIDTPVFPELPKKEPPTPKQSPKVSFWGSHGSYVHRKGSNAGQTSGSETDVVSEEKSATGPSTLPMKMDFDKMEVDDGPDDEPAQPLNPHQTLPNMNPNAVVAEIEAVKTGDIEIEEAGEANTDIPHSTDTPVLLKSPMKNALNSTSLASPTQDSGAMSIPGETVANPPVIVEAVVEPKSDDRSVVTAADDFEQPQPYQSQTLEADLAEKSLVADVAGQIEFLESSPKPIRTDVNTASDTGPMLIDDFEYAPDGHNYGFEDARDAVLLFPKTDSLLNEPSADPSSEAMDVDPIMVTSESDPLADYNFDSYDEFGVANVDNAPIQQLTDTDVVQDSGAAIEDVADEAEAHFEIDNVAEPIEVEAVQDADNAAIAQDEAPHSDEYDADEKPLYEADNETNVQFEFGDVISEAEFHEYFDANVEPEHPDAIEVESDVFDNVSTVEADAELVFEDGFDADPETPAADTNINVVPGDAVDVNADADFEEPCVAEMVDPPVPEAGETDSKPMPSPERVQFEETAIGADESSGFFECSNVIEEDVPETYVEEGSCVAVKEQSEDPGAGMTDGAVVDSSSGRFQMYNGVVEEVAASKADVKTKVEVDAAFKVPKSNGPDVADDSTKILASVVTDNAEIETADDFVDTKAIAPDSDTKIQSSDAAGDTKFEAPDAIEDAEVGAATEIKVPEAIDDATKVGVPQAAGAVTESADEDDNESIISSGSFKYPMESLPDLAETLKLRDEATKMSATLHKCDEVFTRSNDYMRKSLDDFEAQLAKLAIDQAEQELSIARVGKYVEWAENKLTLIAERQNQRQKHVFDLSKTANMNLSKVTHHLFRDDPIRHLHITLKTMIDSCSHLSELQGAAAHVVCSVWGADVIKTIVGWRAEMFSTKSDDGFIPVPASLIYTMAEMMTVLCGMEDPQHARLVLRDFYNSVTAGMQTFLDGVRHDPSSRPNFEGLIDNPHYYD